MTCFFSKEADYAMIARAPAASRINSELAMPCMVNTSVCLLFQTHFSPISHDSIL